MDRFSTCTISECDLPSVRGFGPCERCKRHLCAEHRRPSFHACDDAPLPDDEFDATVQTEVQTIRAQINEEAICSRASALNGGRKCEIQHPPAWGRGSLMGCANYHARIRFDDGDGSVWLLRVPRMNGSLPQSLIDYLVKSEYATLQFLEGTNVPAPRVFDYGIAGDDGNKVGVSYILMEQMPGSSPWNGQGPRGKRFADGQDKERVWSGLADILIELRQHPFPRAGSLLPGPAPSKPLISATASERFLVHTPSGPFDTTREYLTAFAEQNMALIADGQLFTAFPVNAYLVFSFLRDNVPLLLAENTPSEGFYLKHVDDKGDHLMVDDDLNITGIIDWQMARIVPAIEAFGPSLVTADMSDIYNGVSSVTAYDHALTRYLREKGAYKLAGLMSRDERLRRFFFGLDVDLAWGETLGLVRGIWAAFGGERDVDWGFWKADALRRCGRDGRLGRIVARWGMGP